MKIKLLSYGLIIMVCGLFSCVKDGHNNPHEIINYVEVGDPVPVFQTIDKDGNTFHSSEFKGKRSLLVLFTTSCPDCNKIMPDINNIVWEELKDNPDFLLICISRGETAKQVSDYWKFTMPYYLDPDRKIFTLFADSTVPRLYIINEEGMVEWMAIEELNISMDELVRLIKQP